MLGSWLCFTGLALITASTYQILKMFSLIFVVLLSVTLLQKRYNLVQWLSVLIVMGGLLIVSFESLHNAPAQGELTEEENSDQLEKRLVLFGIICMLVG